MKYLIFVILIGSLFWLLAGAHDAKLTETYQLVTTAVQKGDFSVMQSQLILQPGMTFESLQQNWVRAQKMLQRIFPPLNEISILKTLEGKYGSRYWIVELNQVDQGSKHIKAFKFIPDTSSTTGWKVSATAHAASYTVPGGPRDWAIDSIIKKVQAE